MLSTTQADNAQLIISFTGNQNYDSPPSGKFSSGPFQWTRSGEEAAPIDCLCVVSGAYVNINHTTSYSPANCTRYMISGFPPFLGIRVQANAGQFLKCFIPGFKMPSSSGGDRIYLNFYTDNLNHFKYHGIPNQFFSSHQTLGVNPEHTHLQGVPSNWPSHYGPNNADTNSFWDHPLFTNQQRTWSFYWRASHQNRPNLYMSSYFPVPSQSLCNSGSFTQCRTYSTFLNRRHFINAVINNNQDSWNMGGITLAAPSSKDELS